MANRSRVQRDQSAAPASTETGGNDRSGATESNVSYRTACELEEVDSCLRLVHEAYTSSGIMDPHPARIRVIPQHTLPTTQVLMAMADNKVVCTSTLVLDGRLGLPMESIFGDEVANRRGAGKKLAEASCLAQTHDVKVPLSVVVRVMSMTVQCARHHGVNELLAVVHPHHADFYTGFLGFIVFGPVKSYPCVRDNPAVAMSLDLPRLHLTHPRGHKRLFGKPFPDEALRYSPLSTATYEFLKYLMAGKSATH